VGIGAFTRGPQQLGKPYNRLLRPLAAAGKPRAPPGLRPTVAVIDHHVEDCIARARLKPAA